MISKSVKNLNISGWVRGVMAHRMIFVSLDRFNPQKLWSSIKNIKHKVYFLNNICNPKAKKYKKVVNASPGPLQKNTIFPLHAVSRT